MIQSLEKALLLLNAVASCGDWVGVRELSRLTGLKPPTAQQLLKTLQANRYLEFDEESRRYRIGIAAVMLGHGVDSGVRIGEFARHYLDLLFSEYGETCVAFAYERGVYSCVGCRHCEKPLATSAPSRADLANPHVMACGQALLAWQGEPLIDAYIKLRGLSSQGAALQARLRVVRETGYAELVDFNKSAVAAYGVPVFDISGKVAFSLGWSVPLARFDDALKSSVLPRMLSLSKDMSRSLGGSDLERRASS